MHFPHNALFIDTSAIYIQRKTNQRIPAQSGIAACVRIALVQHILSHVSRVLIFIIEQNFNTHIFLQLHAFANCS